MTPTLAHDIEGAVRFATGFVAALLTYAQLYPDGRPHVSRYS